MRPHAKASSFGSLSLSEKRAAILLGLRWKDSGRLNKALSDLSRIRGRISAKAGRVDGAALIRRLRDSR